MLEPILNPTNGVILYQEQVMQIARELAGYTLGSADLLRRAMGKKKPEEMAKQRTVFTEGAVNNGIKESTATYIFDLMEKFSGYGFNKSHSAAYALVAYQTAWLKAHFPAPFLAAVLSSDMDNTDKVVILVEECRSMKLEIIPPSVNHSQYRFSAINDRTIAYGLGAIKGVGESAIESIVDQRNAGGEYAGLLDFCQRLELNKVNKKVLEALVRSGAMDSLGRNRAENLRRLPSVMKTAEQHGRMVRSGQGDLFGLEEAVEEYASASDESRGDETDQWTESEMLREEKATLGLYLSGHPITRYESELAGFTSARIGDVLTDPDKWKETAQARIAGLVVDLRIRESKRGKRMAFVTLDDRSGRLELAIFGDVYEAYRELLSADMILVAEGALGIDEYTGILRLTVESLYSIEQAREEFARNLVIQWHGSNHGTTEKGDAETIDYLRQAMEPFRGGRCQVCVEYLSGQTKTRVMLGNQWKVRPADELLNRLRQKLGAERVWLTYR
jgi:DNA polymerase-3 subunit alpha